MKWFAFALACTLFAPAWAASRDEIMKSRYLKYSFCMQRELNWQLGGQGGPGWMEGHKLAAVMNRWGVTEPTSAAIESASQQIKKLDTECRRLNEIANEPRPG